VVAIWEGSDPVLKNEMVAIGAHYDHVGNSPETGCRPVNGDSLCNGADDDGSGTVSVLSIAEAISHAPKHPKRSILFVWHCGDERKAFGQRLFQQISDGGHQTGHRPAQHRHDRTEQERGRH
jgi:hypothetical protein